MAEVTHAKIEREYVIPLRKEWRKVPSYKRTRKAVLAIKQFIAKHMKVPNRDIDKVKIDVYFNNEVWFRGSSTAPSKVKVKAIKEGDIVKVTFVETPKHVRFEQKKHDKRNKKSDKVAEVEEKPVKTEEEKKEESEKEQSAAQLKEQIAEKQTKAMKHTTSAKEPEIHRMSLKK